MAANPDVTAPAAPRPWAWLLPCLLPIALLALWLTQPALDYRKMVTGHNKRQKR